MRLDADWLSMPALSWFPLQTDFEKEFRKRIDLEFNLEAVISS